MNINFRPDDTEMEEVPTIVRELAELRAHSQQQRYRGPAPMLPSRESVIGFVDDLVSAIYPRHFGPQGLPVDELNAFVGDALRSALSVLRGQAALELALSAGALNNAARAAGLVRHFAGQLPAVRAICDSDARAGFQGDPAATSIDEIIFCYPGFFAVLRHRIAHELYNLGLPMIARIIAEDAHARTGIDIHPGAEIGPRFFIDHGTGVVIGQTAVIGQDVRLYQAVTLGARRFEIEPETGALRKDYPRHPIVEDDVVIYAGATILGRVTIGRGSSIGGNVWLTHSVPPGSRIAAADAQREIGGEK